MILDGQVVYSKLETGRMPNGRQLIEIMEEKVGTRAGAHSLALRFAYAKLIPYARQGLEMAELPEAPPRQMPPQVA